MLSRGWFVIAEGEMFGPYTCDELAEIMGSLKLELNITLKVGEWL